MSHKRHKSPLSHAHTYLYTVLLANFLQAMYSAVDLMVIGRFANADTVQLANAAVGTDGMIMVMVTFVINGLAMGATWESSGI